MKTVDIYTLDHCPYCHRAMALLKQKDIPFVQHRVDGNDALRTELVERTGRRTVPQIFIGGQSIGGCDDLYALEAQGKLEALLAD
ncbi:MAG: glutaredoxin 3 [Pseudomonadota bacterium]